MKLYTNRPDHFFYFTAKIVAEITGAPVESVVVSQEVQDSADFKAKKSHGKFPMLELADGSILFESAAIAQFIAVEGGQSDNLLGSTAFEQAQIQQWIYIAATANWPQVHKIAMNTLGYVYDAAQYAEATKVIKEQVKIINSALQGKEYLVGDRITVADISVFTSLIIAFAFVLDGGFRKAMPNVSAWFQRIAQHKAVVNTCGNVKLCEKQLKAVDSSKLPQVAAKVVEAPKVEAKVEVAEVKAADEDEFDPFADEPEDEEAEKAKMERMKEIAKTAKSYGKVGPVAKSIIIWEVKPWGEETDLDALAAKILTINMEGLVWKTEYKKEPIAYGVFKLVIGAVVEDLKVSTDDVQDKITEFEDDVQSVDIQSFNKL